MATALWNGALGRQFMEPDMTEPLSIGNEKQLFIDDYCISELRGGATRRFHQAKKHPANPLMTPQEAWEQYLIQVYGTVLYDPEMGLYRMWYTSRYRPDGPGTNFIMICHATSKDGIEWDRTPLNMVEHKGLMLGNAVLKKDYIGPTVFYTPEDPDPERKYRMFCYAGREIENEDERKSAFSLYYGVLFSPDGYKWTRYPYPVIQGSDISTAAYDPVTKEYMAFPRMFRYDDGYERRCVGVSTSKDFTTWGAPAIILSADQIDDDRTAARLDRFKDLLVYDDPGYYHSDMYGMTGFRYEGMRMGLIWFYDISAMRPMEVGGNDDGIVSIQLAYSRGAGPYSPWHRVGDRQDFIPCGNEGEYDSCCIYTAHTVVEHEDELRFYYTGFNWTHGDFGETEPNKSFSRIPHMRESINLATLRRDGFASIDALTPAGSMVTQLLLLDGDKLEINADAERGQILVELTDSEGKPIPGYTKEECVPFCRDDVRGEVEWKSGRSLASLEGKPVRIVFHLHTARLYAFKVC